jgi:hypothetical protein
MQLGLSLEPKNEALLSPLLLLTEEGGPCQEGPSLGVAIFEHSGAGETIVWPEVKFNDPAVHIFIISVQGTDFRVWEEKHPTFTIDMQQCSHKFTHGALKYEIAIDVYRAKIVSISRPYPGSVQDKTIYVEGGLGCAIRSQFERR